MDPLAYGPMPTVELMARSAGLAASPPIPAQRVVNDSAPQRARAIVHIDSVSRSFGPIVALDRVSLEIERGEIFGIIGRSGAGKSTLIRTINALERIDTGRIVVDGRDLSLLDGAELNGVRRNIGMIFQHFNLLSTKTVFDNVELPLKLAGRPRRARKLAVYRLLDLVGLREKAHVYPAKLSGGQKQRVGIARALVAGPALLLSDEGTSALDPETTLSILRLLKDLNRTLGVTIVLITHEMSVIREICDRVAVLDHGRIVEQGSVWQVFAHPRTDLTRRLLRSVRPPLPEALQESMANEPLPEGRALLRVASAEPDQYAAVLAALSGPAWQAQIVHAEVDRVQGRPIGTVTFSVRYRGGEAQRALCALLQRQSADVEVLGYVAG
jgi:D-methionine transport system ATP-binding protein